MKQVLLFSFGALFIGATIIPRKSEKGKIYYFCDSRALDRKNETGRQVIQYSDIKEMANNKDSIRNKMYQWGALAHAQCENTSGCTADINRYDTYEQAREQLDGIIKAASDTSRFILRKRDF